VQNGLAVSRDPKGFFTHAQIATGLTQQQLGEKLGVSRRTAQRFVGHGVPHYHLQALARLVHPHDRELAAEIARHAGATLVSLGLEEPPPPPPAPAPVEPPPPAPPPPPPPPADGVVDAVVCAAAESKDAKPSDVRPMLLAAFARAREIGVDAVFVERVLRAQLGLPPLQAAAPLEAPAAAPSRGKAGARATRGAQ
jgi:hypothetical protein